MVRPPIPRISSVAEVYSAAKPVSAAASEQGRIRARALVAIERGDAVAARESMQADLDTTADYLIELLSRSDAGAGRSADGGAGKCKCPTRHAQEAHGDSIGVLGAAAPLSRTARPSRWPLAHPHSFADHR